MKRGGFLQGMFLNPLNKKVGESQGSLDLASLCRNSTICYQTPSKPIVLAVNSLLREQLFYNLGQKQKVSQTYLEKKIQLCHKHDRINIQSKKL